MNCTSISDLLSKNGIFVDVRSQAEYHNTKVKGSINIPVDQLGSYTDHLSKFDKVVVFCRSGARSQYAAQMLSHAGINVHDAGAITNFIGCIE